MRRARVDARADTSGNVAYDMGHGADRDGGMDEQGVIMEDGLNHGLAHGFDTPHDTARTWSIHHLLHTHDDAHPTPKTTPKSTKCMR